MEKSQKTAGNSARKRKAKSDTSEPPKKKVKAESKPADVNADFERGKVRSSKGSAVKTDHLFQAPSTTPKIKKKKRSKKESLAKIQDDEAKALVSTSTIKRVDPLAYKRLKVGTLLLGAIREIKSLELLISLPNNLTGRLSITEISTELTESIKRHLDVSDDSSDEGEGVPDLADFYKVGELIPCVILSLDAENAQSGNKKRIELTAMPEKVNAGVAVEDLCDGMVLLASVKSVEDHGYVMSLGLAKPAFLARKSAPALQVGQSLMCALKGTDGAVLKLTARPIKVSAAKLPLGREVGLHSLRPGMLVDGDVEDVFENGVSINFLDVFSGSVDFLHAGELSSLKSGTSVTARIIWMDQETKSIGMSLIPSHQSLISPVFPDVKVGDILHDSSVVRVEDGVGLFLSANVGGTKTLVFVHISRVADKHVEQHLSRKYKVGRKMPCRILNFNHFDGVLNGTTAQSILEQPILLHSDVKAGDMVSGTILAVKEYGLLVKLTDTIKGLVPLEHLADVHRISKPERKFKEGANIECAVWNCDPDRKKITLTRKKTLLKSTLPKFLNYEDATPGAFSHGVITAVKPFGCIVSFYNNVKALVPVSELSTEFIQDPEEIFKPGQVVKCRVLTVDPVEEKLRCSFILSPEERGGTSQLPINLEAIEATSVGSVAKAKIVEVNETKVTFVTEEGANGVIPKYHLSDHLSLTDDLIKSYAPEDEISVLVLDKKEKKLIGSLKASLIAVVTGEDDSTSIPASIGEVDSDSLCRGYVKDVSTIGVFVSFLGGLTGLASMANLRDNEYVKDAATFFTKGQSVCARVLSVDVDEGKFQLSLKASVCATSKLAILRSFLQEKAFLASRASEASASRTPGEVVEAVVKVAKDYGVVVDVKGTQGFVTPAQSKGVHCIPGEKMSALILDHDQSKDILDLSIRPEMVGKVAPKKKSKLPVGNKVSVVVELVKDPYVVVSLPDHKHALAFAAFKDYNDGDSVKITAGLKTTAVVAVNTPNDYNVVLLSSLEVPEKLKKRDTQSVEDLTPGTRVKATVTSLGDVQMNVSIGRHLKGRIHITEVLDDNSTAERSPILSYKVGDTLDGKVLSVYDRASNKFLPITHQTPTGRATVEVTIKPVELAAKSDEPVGERVSFASLQKNAVVDGYVQSVTQDCLWVALSPNVRGRVFILDVSDDLDILRHVEDHYRPGDPVRCSVLSVDPQKSTLDLSIKAATEDAASKAIKVGNIIPGRVSKITPAKGLNIQVSAHMYARAFICDLSDVYSENPTSAFKKGEFVKCYVLHVDRPNNQIDVSLRKSHLGQKNSKGKSIEPQVNSVEDLESGQVVKGYVKATSNAGCFVSLGRNVTARVLIKNLSDAFIKEPAKVYLPGMLVTGRIVSIDETGRVDLSLKRSVVVDGAKPPLLLGNLQKGQKVKGVITKVADYGVFIRVDNSNISGLCHISEINGEYVKNLGKIYSVNDRVKAFITDIDVSARRISFSLKKEHFDEDDVEDSSDDGDGAAGASAEREESDEGLVPMSADAESSDDDVVAALGTMDDSDDNEAVDMEEDNGKDGEESYDDEMVPVATKKKPSIDKIWAAPINWRTPGGTDDPAGSSSASGSGSIDEADFVASTGASKKAKRKRAAEGAANERRIREQEELLLNENRLPETADDYERLLMGSPNSSFLWIKYMAFQLELTEVDKAREVAKRALKTIVFREEREKLNVWTALMNLENMFGTEESLLKVFQDATLANDPLEVHMQLVQLYTKSGKLELANDLYKRMTKKFKNTPSIWIKWGQFKFRNKDAEGARKVMKTAIQALPAEQHIHTISNFARMEFKFGEAERGRTIFEEILANFPKRVDLWSVFLDQEIRVNDPSIVRRLFDRVTSMKFSAKKMKFFFTKWLEYERREGDDESIEDVREKARRFVASRA